MPYYTKETIDKINNEVPLRSMVPDTDMIKRSGTYLQIECPKCAKKMTLTPSMNLAKCFKCGQAYKGPINYVKDRFNLNFTAALEYICSNSHIIPEFEN